MTFFSCSQLELAPGAIHSSKLLEADTERLMHIKVQLVDRRSPEFVTTYDSVSKYDMTLVDIPIHVHQMNSCHVCWLNCLTEESILR